MKNENIYPVKLIIKLNTKIIKLLKIIAIIINIKTKWPLTVKWNKIFKVLKSKLLNSQHKLHNL